MSRYTKIVCVVMVVLAQDYTTLQPGDNKCKEQVRECTTTFDYNDKDKIVLEDYYNCVWKVHCTKHEDGYNDRIGILSDIDYKLEALRSVSGNWWDNSGSRLDTSFVVMVISMAAAFQYFIVKYY